VSQTQYAAHARFFRRQQGPLIVATAIVVFVAVGIVKPWPEASSGRRAGTSGAVATASATAPASGSAPVAAPPVGPNTMSCLAGETEQVVAVERSAGREIRSWIAAVDEERDGPLGLRGVPISIFSTDVIGLGVCAPDGTAPASPAFGGALGDRDRQAATILDVQKITETGTGPIAIDVGVPSPLSGQSAGADTARLYAPPLATTAGRSQDPGGGSPAPGSLRPSIDEGVWPTGFYAIAFAFGSDPPGVVRWLRIELMPGAADQG
jgi:hypothetical protein